MSQEGDIVNQGSTLPGACKVTTKFMYGTWLCTAGKSKERTEPFLMTFMPINRPAW